MYRKRKGQYVPRLLTAIFLGLLLAASTWSQEAVEEDVAEDVAEEEQQVEVDEQEDSEVNEQAYSDDDDDFRPSETIPADESIAFPTDI